MKHFKQYLTEALSVSKIRSIYDKYNKIAFDSKLPPIPIYISNSKRLAGSPSTMAMVSFKRDRRTGHVFDMSMTIKNIDFPEDVLLKLVVHEMIHVEVAVDGVRDNESHGWHYVKRRDNAERKVGFKIPLNMETAEIVNALSVSDHIPEKEMGIFYYRYINSFYFYFFPVSQLGEYNKYAKLIFERARKRQTDIIEVGYGTIVTKDYKHYPVKVKFPFEMRDGEVIVTSTFSTYKGSLDIYHRIKNIKKS